MIKTFLAGALLTLALVSCKKENNTSMVPINDVVDSTIVPQKGGTFSDGPYGTVAGSAKIYLKNGQYSLLLENVSISNGPDLHVYLSREMLPLNFTDLGKLRSTSGTMEYAIPLNELGVYKYALIHCQLFDHLFGSAPLR